MESPPKPQTCPACGTKYEVVYYQRRAADEPPDEVTYCPNCPLDASKLSLGRALIENKNKIDVKKKRQDISLYSNNGVIKRPIGLHQRNSSIDSFTKTKLNIVRTSFLEQTGTRVRMEIQGSAANRCYKRLKSKNYKFSPIISTTIPYETDKTKILVDINKTGKLANEGHTILDSTRIAPLIILSRVGVFYQRKQSPNYNTELVMGYECTVHDIVQCDFAVLRVQKDGKNPSIYIYLKSYEDKIELQSSYLSLLSEVLSQYGTERVIKSFVTSETISSLYVRSANAYDSAHPPDKGYLYAWKPDGERYWYIKYGSVWLYCRRLLSGVIIGWNVCNKISAADKVGPVLDVELLIGHPPILIDVLLTEDGKQTPATRSLEDVLEEFKYMKGVDTPIFVRDYYKSIDDLYKTKNKLTYPVDGAVGIQDGSMNIIKIKDIKSIELKLTDTGDLLSAEGTIVAKSELNKIYPPDSIIELRFTNQGSSKKPVVTETLLRTDKIKANQYTVCQDIMNTIPEMPDTLSRRSALQWCNSIRRQLYQIASRSTGKGRVIMDIGSGDGQAISDYSDDPTITYVLIEVDKAKCIKLERRLKQPEKGNHRLFIGAENAVKAIGLASNGMVKYAILCANIKDVLKQEHIFKTIKTSVRYCVASFSISHIVPELSDLALNGVDIIGCGYMYDLADKNGILINEFGVMMRKGKNERAVVRWGSDRLYDERAITLNDFKDIFHTRLATNLIPIFDSDNESLLNTISLRVHVISTKKHI